jgi:hypothetical protein
MRVCSREGWMAGGAGLLAGSRGSHLLAALGAVLLVACVVGTGAAAAVTQIGSITYSIDTTWDTAGSPYVVSGTVDVAAGVTLTVQAGVVVKFSGTTAKISVSGALRAAGTVASPVVFTSYQDDSAAGDTNGDESATTGAPGQWTA